MIRIVLDCWDRFVFVWYFAFRDGFMVIILFGTPQKSPVRLAC